MAREKCLELAKQTYRQMDADVMAFVNEMGGWLNLPKEFDVCADGWKKQEAVIDEAVISGELMGTQYACNAYAARVEKFLKNWRQWAKNQKGQK